MQYGLKYFLPVLIALFCITLNFGCEAAGADGGYLANYDIESTPKPAAVSWWSTLAYLLSLVAVFALVVGLAYFTARFIGSRFSTRSSGGGRVLENLPLGPNRSVCVVKIAGRVFLLGVTENNITLLSEITDDETIENLQENAPADIFPKDFGTISELVQKIQPPFRKK